MTTNETKYRPLDEENDAAGRGDGDEDALLRQQQLNTAQRSRWQSWGRIAFEVVLVLAVLGLLSTRPMEGKGLGHLGPNDPRKDFGFVDVVFMNDSKFANEQAFLNKENLHTTLKEWLPMSSKGRGYVDIPEEQRDGMDGPPYYLNPLHRPDMRETYMVSGFHQLHCLSQIMSSYARLRFGEDQTEMGYHIAHCFDYLRQGILCAGDSTLEGNNTKRLPGVEIPFGTAHRCVNWDAMREWADESTIWEFPPAIDTL